MFHRFITFSVDAAAHSPALRKTLTPYPLNILFKRVVSGTAIGIFTTSMG